MQVAGGGKSKSVSYPYFMAFISLLNNMELLKQIFESAAKRSSVSELTKGWTFCLLMICAVFMLFSPIHCCIVVVHIARPVYFLHFWSSRKCRYFFWKTSWISRVFTDKFSIRTQYRNVHFCPIGLCICQSVFYFLSKRFLHAPLADFPSFQNDDTEV